VSPSRVERVTERSTIARLPQCHRGRDEDLQCLARLEGLVAGGRRVLQVPWRSAAPVEGEIIDVVRFLRGRPIRAPVTRANANLNPQIAATQIDYLAVPLE
jgi:hypothetical protein